MQIIFVITQIILLFLMEWEFDLRFPFIETFMLKAREYSWISYIIFPLIVLIWCYTSYRLKKDYSTSQKRSKIDSILMVSSYQCYSLLIIFTSWCNLWAFTMDFDLSFILFIIGSIIGGIFGLFYLKVLIQFHSFKCMVGLETDKLITSGVFKKCRNPHSISKGFAQIGVGIMGRSAFAISICLIWWVLNHFNVLEEEKLLKSLYGNLFLNYCGETPRYFRLFKKKE
jgi:protein-S-isoprenylcysteine O-methyltransferase Ste14